MKKKQPSALPKKSFDNWKQMPQGELELAWLGSLLFRPAACRQMGLLGLDQSMFERSEIFDIGLLILRDESFVDDYNTFPMPPDAILVELIKTALLSKVYGAVDELKCFPSLYSKYAAELENRHESWE